MEWKIVWHSIIVITLFHSGAYAHNSTAEHTKNKLTVAINRGGCTFSTINWAKDFQEMTRIFISHHPKDSLSPGLGLIHNFFTMLKSSFPNHHHICLHLVARLMTRLRVRKINRIEKLKSKKYRRMKKPKEDEIKQYTKSGKVMKKLPTTIRGKKHIAGRNIWVVLKVS